MEVPMEHLHEKIHEEAHEQGHKPEGNWILRVAFSTSIVSVLSALTSLFAGHFGNEAMIEQIRSADQWAYYQAKGMRSEIKMATNKLLTAQGLAADTSDLARVDEYTKDQVVIRTEAEKLKTGAQVYLAQHNQ